MVEGVSKHLDHDEHQKEREEKIALARAPRSSREVVEHEEQRRGEAAPRVTEAP